MTGLAEIAVTGVGLVSPLGVEPDDFFGYLRDAEVPTEKLEDLAELGPGQLLSNLKVADPRLRVARYMDPVSKNAIVALREATADAGIEREDLAADPYGYGIIVGTTRGACVTREGMVESLAARGGRLVSGTLFSHCGYNIAGAMTAIAFGVKGPNITLAGRGDLGLSLLRRARQFLSRDGVHTVFAGFSECDGPRSRSKGLFRELAFFLCLEKKDRARGRGAGVLAEVTEEACGAPANDGEGVSGFRAEDQPLTGGAVALRLPLPGMAAVGDGYASILLVGLLARDREVRSRFRACAFAAGTARNAALVRLRYDYAEEAAA